MDILINRIKTFYSLILVTLFCVGALPQVKANPVPVASAQRDLPEHWSVSVLAEPFYGGSLRIVEAGDPEKPAILLIHGLGQNGLADWVSVMAAIEHDYHLISFDLPGFGGSSQTQQQLSPERYAQLVHWVVQQKTQQAVIVVGHSMGGAISLRYAANFPEQVNKLVMVDTAGILQRTVFVRHLAQLPDDYQWMGPIREQTSILDKAVGKFNRFADRLTARVLTGLDHLPDPAKLLLTLPQAQQYLYKDRANLNAALGLIYEDFNDAIASVSTPTHIIWGEQDRVAPLRTGQLLARQMQQAQLHTIPAAGHVPMSDSTAAFLAVFQQTLRQPPEPTDWLEPQHSERDYHCNNQRELTVTGYYRHINIKDCRYVDLHDVHAESIQIANSIVSMLNVTVVNSATALSAKNSALTLTNVRLDGKVGLDTAGSKIDAAGLNLNATETAIKTKGDNALYFSVSGLQQGSQHQPLHGYSLGDKFALR